MNIAFYKVHFIQDRDVIEEIHEQTEGFSTKRKKGDPVGFETNPQTLANLLVLFENYEFYSILNFPLPIINIRPSGNQELQLSY